MAPDHDRDRDPGDEDDTAGDALVPTDENNLLDLAALFETLQWDPFAPDAPVPFTLEVDVDADAGDGEHSRYGPFPREGARPRDDPGEQLLEVYSSRGFELRDPENDAAWLRIRRANEPEP